jgi:inhibitor of KinA
VNREGADLLRDQIWSWQPLGDQCILFVWQDTTEETITQAVMLSQSLLERPFTGMLGCSPAFATVSVHFDVLHMDSQVDKKNDPYRWIAAYVHELMKSFTSYYKRKTNEIEIPVCYEFELDLQKCYQHARLSREQWVEQFESVSFLVGCLGFMPGFPYLIGLPDYMQMTRLTTPRTHVPRGSIALGGPYCGIYPQPSPGGWQIIGRTPFILFDDQKQAPSLLQVGDRVRFTSITETEFASWGCT